MTDDPLYDKNFPNRPQHEDFWHLSEIILQLDGRFSEGRGTYEEFESMMEEIIDSKSLSYLAMQRALRLKGQGPGSIAAIYLEAFLVGYLYRERYGGKE